jgi:formylglycine-generating enzyme required for sulfatase activity
LDTFIAKAECQQITIALELEHTYDESYLEEVVIKEAGWLRKAVTETHTRSKTAAKILSTHFDFCAIPAGTFQMGSDNDGPVHEVTISRSFYMGKYPVTQAQWEAVTGNNPSEFKGADRPVEQVSWDDCQEFIRRLNATGKGTFRLPTEAEWEYSCRAGSRSMFCFGDNEDLLGDYAWYSSNSDRQTRPVGAKEPNAWGLHDMHGNVWEWCQDWYDDYSTDSATDPQGPSLSPLPVRVFRGGCWRGGADFAASAHRGGRGTGYRAGILGFRLICLSAP